MFEHFLITQFNLLQFPNSTNTDRESWVDWTQKRFAIFQHFCLPSLVHQTNKNFKWLIYFDAATPSEFDEQISELKQYQFINICYVDGYNDFLLKYICDIRRIVSPDTEWMITSRLDNDDLLHCHAIDRIQGEFIPKDQFMISLISGYVYDMESQKMSKYYYPMSPFISIIERNGPSVLGIYHRFHSTWKCLRLYIFKEIYRHFFVNRMQRTVCFIIDKPLWIQLYHGENVSNSFYRGFPVLSAKNLKDFGINQISRSSSIKDIFKYYNYVWWKRYIKATIVRIVKF